MNIEDASNPLNLRNFLMLYFIDAFILNFAQSIRNTWIEYLYIIYIRINDFYSKYFKSILERRYIKKF